MWFSSFRTGSSGSLKDIRHHNWGQLLLVYKQTTAPYCWGWCSDSSSTRKSWPWWSLSWNKCAFASLFVNYIKLQYSTILSPVCVCSNAFAVNLKSPGFVQEIEEQPSSMEVMWQNLSQKIHRLLPPLRSFVASHFWRFWRSSSLFIQCLSLGWFRVVLSVAMEQIQKFSATSGAGWGVGAAESQQDGVLTKRLLFHVVSVLFKDITGMPMRETASCHVERPALLALAPQLAFDVSIHEFLVGLHSLRWSLRKLLDPLGNKLHWEFWPIIVVSHFPFSSHFLKTLCPSFCWLLSCKRTKVFVTGERDHEVKTGDYRSLKGKFLFSCFEPKSGLTNSGNPVKSFLEKYGWHV